MSLWKQPMAVVFRLLAGLLFLTQGGCMSALTTAAMREALRETVDSLVVVAADSGQDADVSATQATDAAAAESPPRIAEPKPPSLDESVDRAVARLKGVGELDAPTQAALLSILEKTSPEDWPAAIDAFAASLAACHPQPHTPQQAATREPAAAQESLAIARAEPEPPLVFPAAEPADATPATKPAATAVSDPSTESPAPSWTIETTGHAPNPGSPERERRDRHEGIEQISMAAEQPAATTSDMPAPPALTVSNASFVSRVRGWGVVERFSEAVFRPGQDVIVYFELDPLTARRSSSGHTTSVDTIFRLLDSAGRQIGEWDFEPIDDTCPAPRRDYFARYFIRIPEKATPGSYRLELMVTDLVAGMSSRTHLDLEVRP